MFKAAKLQARVEALELENEQLKRELEAANKQITDANRAKKEAEGRALQWANMMTYTGKPQSMEGVHDD